MIKKDTITKTRKQIANIFESRAVKDFIMKDLSDKEVLEVIKETISAIRRAKTGKEPKKLSESVESKPKKARAKKTSK